MPVEHVVQTGILSGPAEACLVSVEECDALAGCNDANERRRTGQPDRLNVVAQRLGRPIAISPDECTVMSRQFVEHGFPADIPAMKQHAGAAPHEQLHGSARRGGVAVAVRQDADEHTILLKSPLNIRSAVMRSSHRAPG